MKCSTRPLFQESLLSDCGAVLVRLQQRHSETWRADAAHALDLARLLAHVLRAWQDVGGGGENNGRLADTMANRLFPAVFRDDEREI